MQNRAWVVEELISITYEGANVLPQEAFDIESILQTCDPKGVFPPKRVKETALTDILVPNPK